ncbi:hypothetical protein O3P69_008050 [Scylla paramamosain]|uniref:Uncharacterized protein n=1 Tax=Scylla paramamosain TaxID=85552 RepID=A0AAW0T0Q5_SCYPA
MVLVTERDGSLCSVPLQHNTTPEFTYQTMMSYNYIRSWSRNPEVADQARAPAIGTVLCAGCESQSSERPDTRHPPLTRALLGFARRWHKRERRAMAASCGPRFVGSDLSDPNK